MSSTLLEEKPRACTNCSRAKAKCVRVDNDADICQRCLKNNLTCHTSDSVSKKRRGKATNSRVLEKKLDDIMKLLTHDKEPPRPERPTEDPRFPTEGSAATTRQRSNRNHTSVALSNQSIGETSSIESIFIVPGFEVSFAEANQVLQEYMTTMLPEFPFVPVSTTNSSDMLQAKPLLLKTILWVCRPPPPEASVAFESWFRENIANQVVVLMRTDLEIVQAILIFLAWNDIYFYVKTKDTALVQLALCIIDDLRLTRPQWREVPAFESIVEDAAQMQNNLPPEPKQTGADCRTLMGVFYITSTLCSLLGKRYRFEYMGHFDDYCKQLQRNQEYATDTFLVSLVGIRKIAMKVNGSFWETIGSTKHQMSRGVYSIAVAAIQNELDGFMDQLPSNLKWNHLLRTHYASIRIRLFEPFKFGDKSETLGPTHLRSQTIWNCLQSTHELYDAFRLVPVQAFSSLSVISILHIALAIIKASRLLLVGDSAWDPSAARNLFDFPGMLQQLSKAFGDASTVGSPRSRMIVHGLPIFSEYAEAYRGIERSYLSRLSTNFAPTNSPLIDPINISDDDNGFDFWNQLSDLTNGLFP